MNGAMLLAVLAAAPSASAGWFRSASNDASARIQAEIREAERDPGLYAAQGSAQVMRDAARQAVDEARQLAFQRLAEQIQVTVSAVLRSELRVQDSGKGPKAIQSVERLVQTKVRAILADPASDLYPAIREYRDYPKRGWCTVLVSAPRQRVKAALQADAAAKKELALGRLLAGERSLSAGDAAMALRQFLDAKRALAAGFEGAPVVADAGGQAVELQSHVDGRIGTLLGSLAIRPQQERLTYGLDGRLAARPTVVVGRLGGAGKPVAGLPLEFMLAGPSESAQPWRVVTAPDGSARLDLSEVQAGHGASSLRVRLAEDLFDRLGPEERRGWSMPEAAIALSKARAVAYSVLYRRAGRSARAERLEDSVRQRLAARSFSFVSFQAAAEADDRDIRKAAETNADYLLILSVRAATSREAGYQVYKAQARSVLALYALPAGEPVFYAEGPTAQAAGASPGEAADRAAARLRPALLKALDERIKDLR